MASFIFSAVISVTTMIILVAVFIYHRIKLKEKLQKLEEKYAS